MLTKCWQGVELTPRLPLSLVGLTQNLLTLLLTMLKSQHHVQHGAWPGHLAFLQPGLTAAPPPALPGVALRLALQQMPGGMEGAGHWARCACAPAAEAALRLRGQPNMP